MPRKKRAGSGLGRISKRARKSKVQRANETEEEREKRLQDDRNRYYARQVGTGGNGGDGDGGDGGSGDDGGGIGYGGGDGFPSPGDGGGASPSGNNNNTSPVSSPIPVLRPPSPVVRRNRTRVPRSNKLARRYDPNNPPPMFSLGTMTQECPHCEALSFPGEKINCCHGGRVDLEIPPFPELLKNLFVGDSPESVNFRRHIRKYNNSFSFASIEDTRAEAAPGIYRICGQIYSNTAGLIPRNQTPIFNQIYIYSPEEGTDLRLQNHYTDGCISEVMETINQVINNINPYVILYKDMLQKYNEERESAALAGRDPAVVQMHF